MFSVDSNSLCIEGEEEFGPLRSFFYGLGTLLLRKHYDVIVKDLEGRSFNKLLDIGCGPGNIVARLARARPSARFYCTDPSASMLKMALKNMSKKRVDSRVVLKLGNNRAIPFQEKFDAIISSFSYHHWNERESSIKNLTSYLSDTGFIAIFEYDISKSRTGNSHGVKKEEWNKLEIDGFQKTVEQKNGMIILSLSKLV